jgi:hypothetical protein
MTGAQARPRAAATRGNLGPRVALVSLAAALVLGVLAPAIGLAPAPARAATTDLTLVTDATYLVRPEAGRVSVSIAIDVRNHTSETRTKRFFFDHGFLTVQPGSAGIKVSGAKGATVRVASRTKDATTLRIDFGSKLYSGKAASLVLTFDLPGGSKGANPQVRVGTALVTLPVWAFASTGASGAATVRFPAGWDVAVESGSFARRSKGADGGTVLSTGSLASPLSFFAFVSGQRAAVFADRPLRVRVGQGNADLVLRSWKDDGAWATRMGALFKKALPVLHDAIGIDWPHAGPLVVQEAVSRDAGGYAGLFDPAAGRIEVAYWADHQVAIHEAAHAWFNGALLADRWADEGFASYYGLRAAQALKEKVKLPAMTKALKASASPLNAWAPGGATAGAATGGGAASAATDAYGYAASLALATAIADRVGPEVLARTWRAAAGNVGAYQRPPAATSTSDGSAAPPETVSGPPDWRGLLDLLEAGSGKDLTDLWHTWVVRPDEATLLDARTAARASYGRTLALAGDWVLPLAIRDALRAWRFDDAERLMADARTVVAQRNAVVSMADRDGLALPEAMRLQFEAGTLAAASATAASERNAMLAIEQARDSRSADDDVLSRIGMLGEQPDADLAAARAALAAGNTDATLASADGASRAWTGAWQEGRRRALVALALVATGILLVTAIASRARRFRRARRAGAGDTAA